jgi:hypothetical protein
MPDILIPTLTAVAMISSLSATPDWYPPQCVTIDQCATVDNVKWVPAVAGGSPQLLISSVHGNAVVRNKFAVLQSEDERIHVCMRYDPFGALEVTCLLLPSRLF